MAGGCSAVRVLRVISNRGIRALLSSECRQMGNFRGRAKGAGSPLEEVATVYPIHHASVVEQ
jgi:hypothetical protein